MICTNTDHHVNTLSTIKEEKKKKIKKKKKTKITHILNSKKQTVVS